MNDKCGLGYISSESAFSTQRSAIFLYTAEREPVCSATIPSEVYATAFSCRQVEEKAFKVLLYPDV